MELLIGILIVVTAGWIGWVSWSIVKLLKSNSALEEKFENQKANVNGVIDSMADLALELKTGFKDMGDRMESDLEKLNTRLDLFIKTELTELKTIFRKEQ